jgi:hypothetical protein
LKEVTNQGYSSIISQAHWGTNDAILYLAT